MILIFYCGYIFQVLQCLCLLFVCIVHYLLFQFFDIFLRDRIFKYCKTMSIGQLFNYFVNVIVFGEIISRRVTIQKIAKFGLVLNFVVMERMEIIFWRNGPVV